LGGENTENRTALHISPGRKDAHRLGSEGQQSEDAVRESWVRGPTSSRTKSYIRESSLAKRHLKKERQNHRKEGERRLPISWKSV